MVNTKRGLLVTLLDRSGSMKSLQQETITGMLHLMDEQARLVKHGKMDDITAFVAQFDYSPFTVSMKEILNATEPYRYNYNWVSSANQSANQSASNGYEVLVDMESLDWADLPDMSKYSPRGTTALYDAIGHTIEVVGSKLSAMPEEVRPGKILFAIITDGEENSSVKFKGKQVGDMIKHQTDVYSWEFMFIGCSKESLNDATTTLNIPTDKTLAYSSTSRGTTEMYGGLSKVMSKSYIS